MYIRAYVHRWCGCTGCVLIHTTLSRYDVNVRMYVCIVLRHLTYVSVWYTLVTAYPHLLTPIVDAGREERIRYLEAELARREGEVQRSSAFYQGQVAEFELQIQHLQEDIARWGRGEGGGGCGGGWGIEEKC